MYALVGAALGLVAGYLACLAWNPASYEQTLVPLLVSTAAGTVAGLVFGRWRRRR